MNFSNILSESILSQMPGVILVKQPSKGKSNYLWGNTKFANLVGFKNNDEVIGISDEDIKCNAACNADIFYKHDLDVMNGNEIKTLDIYDYALNDTIGMLGDKKTIHDANSEQSAVLYYGQLIRKSALSKLNHNLKDILKNRDSFHNSTIYFVSKYNELGLSARESECLFYMLRGKTAKEIARIISLDYRTVERYLDKVREKTGFSRKSQLFDLAFEKGILNIVPVGLIKSKQTLILS